MIVQNIYLPKYKWHVKIYYAVNTYYIDDILKECILYNPTIKEYSKIKEFLEDYEYNSGFTLTDYINNKSLMVIGLTTSPSEFQNTLDHEKGHLATHISKEYDIDPYSEKYQYLVGSIGERMFPVAKKFLCEHCKKELTLDAFHKEI